MYQLLRFLGNQGGLPDPQLSVGNSRADPIVTPHTRQEYVSAQYQLKICIVFHAEVTSTKDDSANILSAMSSSSTVKEATNFADAKAERIPFTPFARTAIFSAAIDADRRFSVTCNQI